MLHPSVSLRFAAEEYVRTEGPCNTEVSHGRFVVLPSDRDGSIQAV